MRAPSAAPCRSIDASAIRRSEREARLEGVDHSGPTMASKRITGPLRGHKEADEHKLRELVRAHCLEEFKAAFGRAWDDRLARFVATEPDDGAETEARKIHEQLRDAIRTAAAWAERDRASVEAAEKALRSPAKGPALVALRWWVPARVEPLARDAMLGDHDWPEIVDSSRARFVDRFEHVNLLGLQPHADGSSRFLNLREFAIVSLLGGHWPENIMSDGRGHTVAEVLRAEQKLLGHHLARRGQKPLIPGVVEPKRGNG